jgi:CHASE2 domain-containing sensor protein
MSGMFIAYQFLAFTPDFAECFAHSPAYYVGLLMANSRRSTRDFIIFGILLPKCLIYVCSAAFMIFLAFLAMPLLHAMVSLPIMSAGMFTRGVTFPYF